MGILWGDEDFLDTQMPGINENMRWVFRGAVPVGAATQGVSIHVFSAFTRYVHVTRQTD